jgi:ribosomal protein S18 acetylase RimI-like enzyme
MEIRLLTEQDASGFWTERLRVLLGEPNAFVGTYEENKNKNIESVISKFRDTWCFGDNYILGAFDNNRLIGYIGFERTLRKRLMHKGRIWGMYVAPEARKQGVGRALLNEVINRSRELEGLEQLYLSVISQNETAKALYESVGFKTYGVEERALKLEDGYLDEAFMSLKL